MIKPDSKAHVESSHLQTVNNIQIASKEPLVFTFAGRTEGWPGMDVALYNSDPVFNNTIKECNTHLLKLGGPEILSYFENPYNPDFYKDELKHITINAMQLATVCMLKAKGIVPDAVMGVSMGETSAAYAAGLLTLQESLQIALSYMMISTIEEIKYAIVFLAVSMKKAYQLKQKCATWFDIIFEDGPESVLIMIHIADLIQVKSFLEQEQVVYKSVNNHTYAPYHTDLIKKHKQLFISSYQNIVARPLNCDYYSTVTGKLIKKDTVIGINYWQELACIPVLAGSAFSEALKNKHRLFLQIATPAITNKMMNNITIPAGVRILACNEKGTDELKHLANVMNVCESR